MTRDFGRGFDAELRTTCTNPSSKLRQRTTLAPGRTRNEDFTKRPQGPKLVKCVTEAVGIEFSRGLYCLEPVLALLTNERVAGERIAAAVWRSQAHSEPLA